MLVITKLQIPIGNKLKVEVLQPATTHQIFLLSAQL